MVHKQMGILLTFLLSAILVSQGHANVPVKIERATSPDGRYRVEGIGVGNDEGCRVVLKSLPKGNVVGQFSHGDFQASDSRYHISAVWNKDSSAFALNIDEGRNITVSRVFAENGGSWNEADLPEKAIDRVRAQANTEGGKAQDYLYASEWMSGNKLKFTYQGNTGEQYEVICRLARGAKPRLAFVETIAPEAEPEPKYDYENYVFTVLAGATEGSEDGVGAAAQFKWPHDLAVDSAGNVFVADRGNHLVRKISRDGIVTTLAGSPGKYGRVDGTGEAARFWYPVGMAVDASGNVYVADSSGQAVRKVTPAGLSAPLLAHRKPRGGNWALAVSTTFTTRWESLSIRIETCLWPTRTISLFGKLLQTAALRRWPGNPGRRGRPTEKQSRLALVFRPVSPSMAKATSMWLIG